MDQFEQNSTLLSASNYLDEQVTLLKSMLSYGLNIPFEDIKVSFPSLKNFYFINNVYKSSWAVYIHVDKLPKLLYTGNFLIQGGKYGKRSSRSPFGIEELSGLTSIANTFSYEASHFKQNWTLDINLFENEPEKLNFSVKEYQEFLKLLNTIRSQWTLHLSEEGNIDFVITEFSEPSDPLFFMDLENFDSAATKIKTYFKLISPASIQQFQRLSINTEFEGRFCNLQPGMWLRDDVLIEISKFIPDTLLDTEKQKQKDQADTSYSNPFRIQALKPSY